MRDKVGVCKKKKCEGVDWKAWKWLIFVEICCEERLTRRVNESVVVRGKNEDNTCTRWVNRLKKENEKRSLELIDVKLKYLDREHLKDSTSSPYWFESLCYVRAYF